MPRGFENFGSNVTFTSYALEQMAANAIATTASMAKFSMSAAMAAVEKEFNSRTAKQLVELARAFRTGAVNNDDTLIINQEILGLAQEATVSLYAHYRASGGPSGYRSGGGRNGRYSGGVLERALASSSMVEATPSSLGFIDVDMLNSKAKQWGRLNFGAGLAGSKSPGSRMYPLRMSNLVIGELGLTAKPGKPFRIPVGFFNPEGEFHLGAAGPSSEERTNFTIIKETITTRGIRAEHFLDAGIAVMAREIPARYNQHIRNLASKRLVNVHATSYMTYSAAAPPLPRIPRSAYD